MKNSNEKDMLDIVFSINTLDKSAADWKILLKKVRQIFSADFAVFIERFPCANNRGQLQHDGCESQHLAQYQCKLFQLDDAATKPFPQSYPCAEVVSEGHHLHATFLSPFGVKHGLLIDSTIDKRIVNRLFLGRANNDKAFGESDKQNLNLLAKHFTQAAIQREQCKLSHEKSEVFHHAIECLPIATLLLGRRGHIYHASERAEKMLHDNTYLRRNHGRLETTLDDVNAHLDKKIDSLLLQSHHGRAEASDIFSIGHYQILLKPLKSGDIAEREHVAMFIFDADAAPVPHRELLKKLFRFTNAETRLAILLAQGLSMDEAKLVLGISKHTVRTHLRAMFVKCGVSRQANLVQKIVTSAAMLH